LHHVRTRAANELDDVCSVKKTAGLILMWGVAGGVGCHRFKPLFIKDILINHSSKYTARFSAIVLSICLPILSRAKHWHKQWPIKDSCWSGECGQLFIVFQTTCQQMHRPYTSSSFRVIGVYIESNVKWWEARKSRT
jgi:hypothetical protein